MDLKLYNTRTRSKDVFQPIDAGNVRLYVCGPTVYDYVHIGNGRTFLTFDLLYRVLRLVYGANNITYVRNITDIDDKINARATKRGQPISEITAETSRAFRADMGGLLLMPPTHEPRATDYIDQMIKMISTLIDKGHAYAGEGHVLFDVGSFDEYGKLSGRSTDEMIAGARIDVAPYKKGAMDFVLWKPSDDNLPGWESPWGRGRPGWHIECSAMSEALLGETFDIHGGGVDLVFPHHENEIAQSVCTHGSKMMANVWMHGGFLQIEGDKMSKSLGNFHTVHDLLAAWPAEALRLQMFQTHYRQPLDWTEDGAREAKSMLDHWYQLTADVGEVTKDDMTEAFLGAMLDDLNTPAALAELHRLRQEAAHGSNEAARALKANANLLGLLVRHTEDWVAWRPKNRQIDEQEIELLIAARNNARRLKDFKEADRIRDELAEKGIVLKDGPDGTSWEIAL